MLARYGTYVALQPPVCGGKHIEHPFPAESPNHNEAERAKAHGRRPTTLRVEGKSVRPGNRKLVS